MKAFFQLTAPALLAAAALSVSAVPALAEDKPADSTGPLVVVVMDPLSAPLACDCVKGYAQRKYEHLGNFLQRTLGRPVKVHWSTSLALALEEKTNGRADLIIGKYSVVKAQASASKLSVDPIASLSGKDGKLTQTGLICVRAADPAKSTADLKGYRIFFGPVACDEKSAAVKTLLKKHGVSLPEKDEIFPTCTDSATALLEQKPDEKVAAVISNYAQLLLEGCGNVKKGDLRVVGESEPVPFITAFVNREVPEAARTALLEALLDVGNQAPLLIHLETLDGFVPFVAPAAPEKADKKPPTRDEANGKTSAKSAPADDWPGWRGPRRDAVVESLPDILPAKAEFAWTTPLGGEGVGGIAATPEVVVAGGRDFLDQNDVFAGLDARTGEKLWSLVYPAPGKLDYGNSPRATPFLAGGKAYLFGAQGHLHCVDLKSGEIQWSENLAVKYGTRPLTWGLTGSPLMVDGRLIVQPGGARAGIVALNPETGDALWESEGHAPGHSSLVPMKVNGTTQLIGYDQKSLGGWDAATGKRLWTLTPPSPGDFNVPTPLVLGERLVVATENNGLRLYEFDADGAIQPDPVATSERLSHDTASPVAVGSKVFGVTNGLKGFDASDGLKPLWTLKDRAFRQHASLIAAPGRLLAMTYKAELVLLDVESEPRILSRLTLRDDSPEVYSHPALCGTRLYARLGRDIVCLDLAPR